MDKIVKHIEKCGTLTGSRLFGVANPKSDWDYFFNLSQYQNLVSMLDEKDIKYSLSPYKKGIYLTLDNKQYNLFCLSMDEYQAWHLATKTISEMVKNNSLKTLIYCKDYRVRLFETLCVFYKQNLHVCDLSQEQIKNINKGV